MTPGEIQNAGDGVYVHYDGFGYELRANHHESPTDRVYLEPQVLETINRLVDQTNKRLRDAQ